MLRLIKRGKWYHAEGKNSMGVNIDRHTLEIAVYDRKGKVDKVTKQAAEQKLIEMEKLTEWHGPHHKAKVIEPPVPQGLSLADAYEKWLAQYTKDSSTWRAYRTLKGILIEPLSALGVVLVKDVRSEHLNDLQNSWLNEGQTLNTIRTRRQYSSCLLSFCVNFHDLAKNPWKPVPTIKEIKPSREEIMAGKRKDKGIATLPLDLDRTRKNWQLIQDHVPAFVRGELVGQTQYRANPLFQHLATFLTLLWLMYETGLRRSDAVIFRPDRIVNTRHGGSYNTAQVKTGDDVTVFLPQPLVDQLRALPLLKWRGTPDTPGAGLYPFYDGSCACQESYMEVCLNRPLRELGKLIGIPGSLRPHRFRDSFAVNMLSLGLSLEDVKCMLGHKLLATTEKYYAPYVLGIQEAVEQRQAAARQAALYAEAQQAFQGEVSVN